MKLRVLTGDMEGHEFEFDGEVITIGRRAENDVPLPLDLRISRFHAQLTLGPDGTWLLQDLESTNGTFLEHRRLHAPTPVGPGDRFRMGRTWLEVLEEAPEAAAADAVVLVEPEAAAAGPEGVVYSLQADAEAEQPRTVEELAQRLRVMRDVGGALGGTLDLPVLLDQLMRAIMSVVPAERGFLLLLDPTTGELQSRAVWPPEETEVAISRSIVEKAMGEGVALLTSDAMSDERFQEVESVRDLQIRSAICAPLLRGDQRLGVIFLDTTSATHVFDRSDVELVTSIASQATIAIENARLYTDLKAAYEDLKNAQEQAVRSEKLSIIGTLSASIAHDMANIAAPMVTLMDLALENGKIDDQSEAAMRRQLQRLTALVERLMSFSKAEELELASTDLNEVVASTLSLLRTELLHESVELDLQLAEDLPRVNAVSTQLDRVLLNLCLNAMEAMCDRSQSPEEPRRLSIKTELDGDEVAVSVTDTGPGIPVDQQERLFEPFFTTKGQGTGLGLFSCRRIVEEEHGGSIEVDSRVGEGTTFTVRLPVPE
jgi:signal transduction histidine kinase